MSDKGKFEDVEWLKLHLDRDELTDKEKQEFDENCRDWFVIASIGDLGIEGLVCTSSKAETSRMSEMFQLRARFNSHRNIKVYAWLQETKVTYEMLDNLEFRENVVKNATCIY